MSLLGSDPAVVFDRRFPYENRYLTCFVKLALLLQRPDLFQFIDGEQLLDPNYLGFGGHAPGPDYAPAYTPHVYLPRSDAGTWVRNLWEKFCCHIIQQRPGSALYAEKAPPWLPPIARQFLKCFTIYNLRDPRDVFISTNAFIKKRGLWGFGRSPADTDLDHARHLALAFLDSFENYYADRNRPDTLLVRYEDFVLDLSGVNKKVRTLTGADPKCPQDYLDSHATAKDLEHSVNRWRSEPIPEEIVLFLEENLHAEMTQLGYPLSLWDPKTPTRTISFVDGRIKLSCIDHSSHGAMEQNGDYAVAHISGPDFYLHLPIESFAAREVMEVWVCVTGNVGSFFSLYWRKRGDPYSEICRMDLAYSPSPQWTILAFPVHTHPEWTDVITHLRLDLFNNFSSPHKGSGRIRWMRFVR